MARRDRGAAMSEPEDSLVGRLHESGTYRAIQKQSSNWELLMTILVCGLLFDHLGFWNFGLLTEHTGTVWEEIMGHSKDLVAILTAAAGLTAAWKKKG